MPTAAYTDTGPIQTRLDHLNDDVLLHIFSWATVADLRRLCCVCQRFGQLIGQSVLPRRCADLLMTGLATGVGLAHGRTRTVHQQRTLNRGAPLQRLRVHDGWQGGRYAEHTLFEHRIMYPSFVHLERRSFYMSHGGVIRRHRRRRTDCGGGGGSGGSAVLLDAEPQQTIGSERLADVTCFRRRQRVIFGGRENGDYFVFDERQPIDGDDGDDGGAAELCEARTLDSDGGRATVPVVAVDMRGDCFVTANRRRLTVWRREWELGGTVLEPMADVDDEYKAVCLQPGAGAGGSDDDGATCGEWLACGKYRDRERTALELIHVERNLRQPLNSRTTSVYDVRWLDASTLLTANYDSTCRIHDIRSNSDVITWMDPYDAAVYTLATDGQHAILCGMSAHCRVNLYDRRQARTFVQMFYPRLDQPMPALQKRPGQRNQPQQPQQHQQHHHQRGSPVYSLACDATQLFVATDHNLRVLDFSAHWAQPRDYRNIFAEVIM